MRSSKLFLTSAVLVVVGVASLWSKWNGSAGVNAGSSLDAWAVSFNGSVHGLPALVGLVAILAAIVIFLVAIVRLAMK